MKYLLLFLISFNLFADADSDIASIQSAAGSQGNVRYIYKENCRDSHPGATRPVVEWLRVNDAARACMMSSLTAFQAEQTRFANVMAARDQACDNLNNMVRAQFDALSPSQKDTFLWRVFVCNRR